MLTAGTTVPGGYYFDRDGLDLVAVAGPEGILPGEEGQRYVRMPTWAALLVAPVLGVACVVLIPLFAFVRLLLRLLRVGLSGATTTGRVSSALLRLGRRAVRAVVARLRGGRGGNGAPPSHPTDERAGDPPLGS